MCFGDSYNPSVGGECRIVRNIVKAVEISPVGEQMVGEVGRWILYLVVNGS